MERNSGRKLKAAIPATRHTEAGGFLLIAGPRAVESREMAHGNPGGADGIFPETHPHPASAKPDGANMPRFDLLEGLLEMLTKIRDVVVNM